MTEPTLAELEAQVAAVRAKAEQDARDKALADYRRYIGKVYMFSTGRTRRDRLRDKSFQLTRVGEFRVEERSKPCIEYCSETISVVVRPGQPRTRWDLRDRAGFYYNNSRYEDAAYFSNVLCGSEVPNGLFEELLSACRVCAGRVLGDVYPKLIAGFPRDITEDPYQFKTNCEGAPRDYKHIVLERGERDILNDTPYTLCDGEHYLVTPASYALARQLLEVEREQLSRGRHLYQECDMHYVSGRLATLAGLQAKLEAARHE